MYETLHFYFYWLPANGCFIVVNYTRVGPMGDVCLYFTCHLHARERERERELGVTFSVDTNEYLMCSPFVFFDIINKPIKQSKWMLWLIGVSDTVWILPVSASQQLVEVSISLHTMLPWLQDPGKHWWYILKSIFNIRISIQRKKCCHGINTVVFN